MHGALLVATLLAQGVFGETPRAEDLFLPVFACEARPLDDWLQRFEGSGGRSSKALWCIFYRDDGSTRVRDTLRRWHRDTPDPFVRSEILAILTHWGIDVGEVDPPEAPPVPRSHDRDYAVSEGPFTPPFAPFTGDLPALREALLGGDRVARARAALALIRNPGDVELVVHTLVRALFAETRGTWCGRLLLSGKPGIDIGEITGHALEWCIEFAGDAADAALIALLQHPDSDHALLRFVLRQVRFSSHQDAARVGRALAAFVVRSDDLGGYAMRRLLGLADWTDGGIFDYPAEADNPMLFGAGVPEAWNDPALEELLAGALESYVEAELHRDRLTASFMERALPFAIRSARMRERLRIALLPALERDDALGDAALYALAALGEHGPTLRRRYVAALDAMVDLRYHALARVPCLTRHDAETLAALERLYRRVKDPAVLVYPFFRGGLLQTDGPALGREFLDALEARDQIPWPALYEMGMRGEPALRDADPPLARIVKLGITVRTRQRRGRDATEPIRRLQDEIMQAQEPQGDYASGDPCSWGFRLGGELGIATPEFLDWSLEFLLYPDRFHHRQAADMLARDPLDRRQQAVLCHAQVIWGIADLVDVLAAQGERSLERVAEIRGLLPGVRSDPRTLAPRIDLDTLAAILRITRPTLQEQAWLVAAIGSGICTDRERALDLIAAPGLDTPTLRAAGEAAAGDVDSRVRAAAARVRSAWGE